MIVDYCISTDSVQSPYEVILEAYSSRGHRSVSTYHDGGSMRCCMSTGAVQVPSRGYSRGLHQSCHQTDLVAASFLQTLTEDRRRIQGTGRTLLFVHMEKRLCQPIMMVDQCVVVCQQAQYKFLHEVILFT